MSEKKRGGLDYTPRAFPGARDPDGPAPSIEEQLAQMGLVERTETKEPRADASAGVHPGTTPGAKKRSSLEYTPQAFPGARAPDGPAPDLEERLAQMGLVERAETRNVCPDAKHDTGHAPAQLSEPRERPAPSPLTIQRERVSALVPQARSAPSVSSPPPVATRERIATPYTPNSASIPTSEVPRPAERRAPLNPEPPRHTERVALPSAPGTPPQAPPLTPNPVYIISPPSAEAPAQKVEPLPQGGMAGPRLPLVPPEAAPRPLPVGSESVSTAPDPDIGTAAKSAPKPARRPPRGIERLRKLPSNEERCRLSVRLVASVDDKLNDLAHLRGLDRNTAVSVAIVQDWVECFGLQKRQETR